MRKYIFVLLSMITFSLSAQNIHSGYHSNAFILNSNSNPASFPDAKVVFGFPALSHFSLGLQSPLSFNELFINLVILFNPSRYASFIEILFFFAHLLLPSNINATCSSLLFNNSNFQYIYFFLF